MNTQHSIWLSLGGCLCSGMAVLNIFLVVLILMLQSCSASSLHHQNMMRFNHPKRRQFNIGSIKGTKVIYVMSGERRGSANSSLSFGDVSIPKYGQNLLGEIDFGREEILSIGQPMKKLFWLEVDKTWFNFGKEKLKVIRTYLKTYRYYLEFQQCENTTRVLPKVPKVEYGLRGAIFDLFLNNVAYRKFLFKEFQISTVDEESSAVVMVNDQWILQLRTTMSNGVPSIVIRGVSRWGRKQNIKIP
ncbi:hypothetical protein MKW92_042567 [Papaver armeniacum]|nr:hypothetical protein MKW92_042567 [Papaver armeniacum]